MKRVLWVDDEIDLLKPYFIFLESKGYALKASSNGNDAIDLVKKQTFDVVLLDEMMPGKDGLTTLQEIKDYDPSIKVIMVTKSEEESIMEEAIGNHIDDYLIKPVNPNQVLLSLKKTLEFKDINSNKIQSNYLKDLNEIETNLLNDEYGDSGWLKLHEILTDLAISLDSLDNETLHNTFSELKKSANHKFSDYIASFYEEWMHTTRDDRPKLSVDIVREHVCNQLKQKNKCILIVLDCLRLDHWKIIESILHEFFIIETEAYYSILPTSTQYARNGIFSGHFSDEFNSLLPGFWDKSETELNKDEQFFLKQNLNRNGLFLEPYYIKCLTNNDIDQVVKQINNVLSHEFTSIVVNTIDMITHSRAESNVLKEIIPNDKSYRSLVKSWFKSSSLFQLFKELGQFGGEIIVTTDHGSIQCKRDVKVAGDKDTSTNLRYKHGKSLSVPKKFAVEIKDPHRFRLPHRGFSSDYIISKEDYYFIYPTQYHKFASQYAGSYQHGGISMDEMIIPLSKLRKK